MEDELIAGITPEGTFREDPVEVIEEEEVVQPEVVQQGSFPAPFRSDIGNSTVDLSIAANEEAMKREYDEWWNYGKKRGLLGIPYTDKSFKPERDNLKNKWYQKYHGMTLEEYNAAYQAQPKKTIYGYDANLKGFADQLDNNFKALSVPGLAWADFAMDAAGTLIPGMGKVDDRWDKATKLDNEMYQTTRRVLSVVLPAIKTGGLVHSGLKGVPLVAAKQTPFTAPWIAKHLTQLGAYGLADGAVAVLSDTGEDHNAMKTVADLVPGMFGPKGVLPIPEAWKTKESDSPAARKMMNFYENGALSSVGTILGAFIDAKNGIKTAVDFIEPVDQSAKQYKQLELLKLSDPDDLVRLQELNTILSTKKLSKQNENLIINEILEIQERLGMTGRDLDSTFKRKELGFAEESDAADRRKLQNLDEAQQLEL